MDTYQPVGDSNYNLQKKSDIAHIIKLLEKYKDDKFIEDIIEALGYTLFES